jgi:hypothetical protein
MIYHACSFAPGLTYLIEKRLGKGDAFLSRSLTYQAIPISSYDHAAKCKQLQYNSQNHSNPNALAIKLNELSQMIIK